MSRLIALLAVVTLLGLTPRPSAAAISPHHHHQHHQGPAHDGDPLKDKRLAAVMERLAALPLDDPAGFKRMLEQEHGMPPLDDVPTLTGQLQWLKRAAGKVLAEVPSGLVAERGADGVSPYWRFVPLYEGSVLPGGSLQFATDCYGSVTMRVNATTTSMGGYEYLGYALEVAGQKSRECQSRWMVSTAGVSHRLSALFDQRIDQFVNVSSLSDAERFLMNKQGLRVFTFNGTLMEHVLSMVQTALLFLPPEHDPVTMLSNMNFINEFAHFDPPLRQRLNVLTPINPDTDIQEGDVIFKANMKGLGTSIQLGTGGTPNHVAIPIRDDQGQLQVCESTDPQILCTPYAAWMQERMGNVSAVVLAPLLPELRAKFNRTKAWEFINATVGLEYGYNNFLFGWIDTPNDSYPCFPPEYKRCMVFEHVEYIFQWLERLSMPLATKFFLQALNHRAGTQGLRYAELAKSTWQNKGLTPGQLMAVPEDDAWMYNTTRNGKPVVGRSMVCSTYGCNVLRAAGVFDGNLTNPASIQCGEQTPWNMLAYRLYDTQRMGKNRPLACQLTDPENANCQLSGPVTFNLGFTPNVQELKPGMGNDCESVAPWYKRGPKCQIP